MNIHQSLKKHFNHTSFRQNQEAAIKSILSGKDTVVIAPTGGGKSLCFQLPALMLPGLTLVISPLISLMQDQVNALNAKNIPAAYLNSTNTEAEKREIVRNLSSQRIKILYCSPERMQNRAFQSFLTSLKISMIAIDEAHCISSWGHDFRPSYGRLSILRAMFPGKPIMALTATATDIVKKDIIHQLGLEDPKEFMGSFDRPNLIIEVRKIQDIYGGLAETIGLNRNPGSNIVYCLSRDDTVGMSQFIETITGFGTSAHYHAGMKKDERQEVQDNFISGKVKTVVATTAFGMGIDKADVRLVINATMSKTMENYYQEIGRAGRDGKLSKCVMLYNRWDVNRWEFIINMSTEWKHDDPEEKISAKMESRQRQKAKLREVARYAEGDECRRKTILGHFGEYYEGNCGGCDVCI